MAPDGSCGWIIQGTSAIGGTPMVQLAHLAGEDCAEVWVKIEGANPTGSYEDRMALAMIEAAEADGPPAAGPLPTAGRAGSGTCRSRLPSSRAQAPTASSVYRGRVRNPTAFAANHM